MSPIQQRTQQDLLDLLDRVSDSGYLEAMKANLGPGYEVLQGMAKVGERISLGAMRMYRGALPLTAGSGMRARGVVEFYRLSGVAGSVTVKAGAKVATSATGLEYVLLADVVFSGATLGPVEGTVEAIAWGYEWNVPGRLTLSSGEVIPGEIDTVTYPLQDPQFADPTIMVRQIAEMTGGAPPTLDEIGAMRGTPRRDGESNTPYLARVTQLPDTVSPDAINRAMVALLNPLGYAATITETWQADYQNCWDAIGPTPATGRIHAIPAVEITDGETFTISGVVFEFDKTGAVTPGNFQVIIVDGQTAAQVADIIDTAIITADTSVLFAVAGGIVTALQGSTVHYSTRLLGSAANSTTSETVADPTFVVEGLSGGADIDLSSMMSGYDPTLFVYDDPRDWGGAIVNRWLDEMDHAGAFFVTIPSLPAMRDVGMAYDDDTSTLLADHATAIGQRAHNAYDVDETVIASVLRGGYDGFDLPRMGVYMGAYRLIQELRPFGVLAQVELAGQ